MAMAKSKAVQGTSSSRGWFIISRATFWILWALSTVRAFCNDCVVAHKLFDTFSWQSGFLAMHGLCFVIDTA